jgi:hypothetical protein
MKIMYSILLNFEIFNKCLEKSAQCPIKITLFSCKTIVDSLRNKKYTIIR